MSLWNADKDDEIWKELRYWIENPLTEEENKMRDKEISDYVESVVTRMFNH